MGDWEKSFKEEFETVDLFVGSEAETRAVDAFALTLIKSEKQLRKIFTHLIFQFQCFSPSKINQLIEILANEKVYFDGIIDGINNVYRKTVEEVFNEGGKDYNFYIEELEKSKQYRNKIFHGQITGKGLSRPQLIESVEILRTWCKVISEEFYKEIGFSGFERDSFQKSSFDPNMESKFKCGISSIEDYKKFIRVNMIWNRKR